MEELFTIQASNFHQSLLLKNASEWDSLVHRLNKESLAHNWAPMDFYFQAQDKKSNRMPDICSVYVPGVLACKASVKESLFPVAVDGLEFLPIRVEGADESWLLLNCLKEASDFDAAKSQVMRSVSGEIFMILGLTVARSMIGQHDIFTIKGSNRMQLFALSSFKRRLDETKAKGVVFQRIGSVL